ncbi:MAG: DNA replication/repair protein RecF, partial [Bacteroidia bacterium]
MYLTRLTLFNFKNYTEAELEFSSGVNCFSGNNGSGKTNLLDAIHYLGLCKSYFNPIDTQNIKYDQNFFVIQGSLLHKGNENQVYCGMKRNQKKKFSFNKTEYSRLSDHIGLVPVVMISPTDHELITGGSEERRRLIDSMISQYNKLYLDDLISYNKALSQRNSLLKHFDRNGKFDYTSLEIWDEQLVSFGYRIHSERVNFIKEFLPLFADFFEYISGGSELVEIEYSSQLNSNPFSELLKQNREKDRIVQFTTTGIHKDDLEMKIHNYPIKKFGSQGQQKSFLIALKLAQFQFFSMKKGVKPILLLDDIFDKLDEQRVTKLMELVSQDNFSQIFITDTHSERVT